MPTSADYVRRHREKQRLANPKEPNWRDLEGRLGVVTIWQRLGNPPPDSFISAIRALITHVEEDRPAGEPPRSAPDDSGDERAAFDQHVQQLRDQLPKRAGDKLKRDLDKFLNQLHSDFQDAVEREVQKRLQPERDRLLALEQEARADNEAAKKRLAGITALMTEEEYNLIRGLLHPDRHPGEDQDRYVRAFRIFKRLKETITPGIPVSVLRARGWA